MAEINPRLWIGSLSDYNAGNLIGDWYDISDAQDIYDGIEEVLSKSLEPNAEEWFFADHEGWGGYQPGEYESPDTLGEIAEALHTVYEPEAFAIWLDNHHGDIEYALATFNEAYLGFYGGGNFSDPMLEYAYQYVDDTGMLQGVDAPIASYFDYEKFARDLRHDVFEESGYIFSMHL